MRDLHIWNAFLTARWALEMARFEAIFNVLLRRQRGEPIPLDFKPEAYTPDADERPERQALDRSAPRVTGSVAVIPIVGTLGHRMHSVENVSGSGGTSTERVGLMLDQALGNPEVSSIILDIDSPGGTTAGITELAAKIFAARDEKRIVAIANPLAASAAFWLASAASEFVATPSGDVGSVGVFAVHLDQSAKNEAEGIKPTIIGAGKFKTELSPHGELSEEARASVQAIVNAEFKEMTAEIARFRGVKPAEVRGGFGEGRIVRARSAVGENMIDRLETFEQLVGRMRGGRSRRGPGTDTRRRRQRNRARQLSV